MISAQNLIKELKSKLTYFSDPENTAIIFLLLEHYYDLSKTDILLNPEINPEILPENVINRLNNAEPIQYVLEKAYFHDLTLFVNPAVLIPRPETEELVSIIIKKYKPNSILDIGTGSGCIPIFLKKNIPNADIYAIDISQSALAVAKKNAVDLGTEIQFIEGDILVNSFEDLPGLDLIVSNPPYVFESEKLEMENHVLNHEPHLALFVPDHDPLVFYKKIAELATKKLISNGSLAFEINAAEGPSTCKMLENLGFNEIELEKDFFGKDRFVFAKWYS